MDGKQQNWGKKLVEQTREIVAHAFKCNFIKIDKQIEVQANREWRLELILFFKDFWKSLWLHFSLETLVLSINV